MMELFLRDIHDLTDHYVYEQGEQLYRSTSFNVEKRYLDKQNVTYYSTRATFGFESIQMSISVDDSYHITQFYCNCSNCIDKNYPAGTAPYQRTAFFPKDRLL